jgi:uncharacterized protein
MLGLDINYTLLIIVSLLLSGGAQLYISSQYKKWGNVQNSRNVTGSEAGRLIVDKTEVDNIKFESSPGELSDHYDPKSHTIRLSEGVAQKSSVASVAIVAHELGHALQHQKGTALIQVRNLLLPAITISPQIAYILIILGLSLRLSGLFELGILFYSLVVFFSLLTIPIEFDASRRALILLKNSNIMNTETELNGAKSVLRAAGFTYVATGVTALLQLLYFLSMGGRRNR